LEREDDQLTLSQRLAVLGMAILLAAVPVVAIRFGKVLSYGRLVERKKDPTLFWMATVFYGMPSVAFFLILLKDAGLLGQGLINRSWEPYLGIVTIKIGVVVAFLAIPLRAFRAPPQVIRAPLWIGFIFVAAGFMFMVRYPGNAAAPRWVYPQKACSVVPNAPQCAPLMPPGFRIAPLSPLGSPIPNADRQPPDH
jgi:hypothetical protein